MAQAGISARKRQQDSKGSRGGRTEMLCLIGIRIVERVDGRGVFGKIFADEVLQRFEGTDLHGGRQEVAVLQEPHHRHATRTMPVLERQLPASRQAEATTHT